MTWPISPSKAVPVPVTLLGLFKTACEAGLVSDTPSEATEIASQMPPLVFPSRRESVTLIVPLTISVLRTRTTASTSCVPPPLSRVVVELGDQFSRFAARALRFLDSAEAGWVTAAARTA